MGFFKDILCQTLPSDSIRRFSQTWIRGRQSRAEHHPLSLLSGQDSRQRRQLKTAQVDSIQWNRVRILPLQSCLH